MPRIFAFLLSTACVLVALGSPPLAFPRGDQPKWLRVSSDHFSLLTDGSEKQAGLAILRMEQMRAVFGQLLEREKLITPEPLDLIGFRTTDEYDQASPPGNGRPTSGHASFIRGEDRNYIVLDLSDEEGWRAIARDYAAVLLNYNYPPAQAWFDEGLVDYFSSLRISATQTELGGDPSAFAEALTKQPWIPLAELFAVRENDSRSSKAKPAVFTAESWIVMHYLVNHDQLSEAGAYLGMVAIQKLPIEQAFQKAFNASTAQFEETVKAYFQSIAPSLSSQNAGRQSGAGSGDALHRSALPFDPGNLGTITLEIRPPEAQALVAEMKIRIPERRSQAANELHSIAALPKGDSAVIHRALAWATIEDRQYDAADEELAKALDLNHNDPWTHYYSAWSKYRKAHDGKEEMAGLPNMMQDCHTVTDWYHDFAEAYHLLGLAQLQGGGANAAAATLRIAIQLNPRNQGYLYDLARSYLGAKKWDAATELLGRLKDNPDPEIAAAARKSLNDLPTLKKYGILPEDAAKLAPTVVYSQGSEDDESDQPDTAPAAPQPDRRKVQFLKGKVLTVDCSQAPAAVVKVASASKTMKLRTEDYKSLLLIGGVTFSCDWKDLPVVINYKAGGKADGDLVSIEIP